MAWSGGYNRPKAAVNAVVSSISGINAIFATSLVQTAHFRQTSSQ